jgi:hypothetical protein
MFLEQTQIVVGMAVEKVVEPAECICTFLTEIVLSAISKVA